MQIPMDMFLAVSVLTLALDWEWQSGPRMNEVLAIKNTAAYRAVVWVSLVQRKMRNPIIIGGAQAMMKIWRRFSFQLE